MIRKLILGSAVSLCVVLLILSPVACGKQEQPAEQEETTAAEEPAAEPAAEVIYTRADPGPWAGKEEGHVPQVVYEKTDSGLRVTVTVDHEMNPDTPHYIMWVELKDEAGNLLGRKEFLATDEKAEGIFELDAVPAKLWAFEKCNLHGVWLEEIAITE